MLRAIRAASVFCLMGVASQGAAQDVKITAEAATRSFDVAGKTITISRIQDQDFQLSGEFARTSRPCPQYCLQPAEIADGVETLAELEVIDFLEDRVASGNGILIDARVPAWYTQGTIPGAVNIPVSTLSSENPYRADILKALGAVDTDGRWNFDGAVDLALFCNGPWCSEAPSAIQSLLAEGYPASKLKYYRGGMQVWLLMGLTAATP